MSQDPGNSPHQTKPEPPAPAAESFARAVQIMAKLRAPGGCPWDREQTFDSITRYTVEETYEVLDAIERRNWPDVTDELGDLLLQVLFYAQIGEDSGLFTIKDVIDGLNRKLIRRHPHVFGDVASRDAGNLAEVDSSITGSELVVRNWDAIKAAEKAQAAPTPGGYLDSVPRALPAVQEAGKLGSKAAKVGFDWPEVSGLFDKVQEEIAELQAELARPEHEAGRQEAIQSELGDLLFTVVNLGRRLSVDPELALRGTNSRFRRRFSAMEQTTHTPLAELQLNELEQLWAQAKKITATRIEDVTR